MGKLEGKIIVVTGASRGIGEAMSAAFARQGAHVVLAARDLSDLERVAKACARSTIVQTDITDEAQVSRLVSRTMDECGRIDCFVANAGISYLNLTDKRYTDLTTYDLNIVRQIVDVNVIGTWLCMKHALPAMQDGSSFVIVGSETGQMAYPGSGFYAITKLTNDAMVKMAAAEQKERGVRVNRLTPGGMVDTYLFGPNKMPEAMKQRVPSVEEPDIVVPAAIWLAADASRDVTGAFIVARELNEMPIEEYQARLTSQQLAPAR